MAEILTGPAPIFDPVGTPSAVLDISALQSPRDKLSQFLALQIVKSFAHRTGMADLIRASSRNWIVKLTSNQALVEVDTEHLLVLDSSGRIIRFNKHAGAVLAEEMRTNWRGTTRALARLFSEFFGCDIDSLIRLATSGAIERNVTRLSATSCSLFIQVGPPATKAIPSPAPRPRARRA